MFVFLLCNFPMTLVNEFNENPVRRTGLGSRVGEMLPVGRSLRNPQTGFIFAFKLQLFVPVKLQESRHILNDIDRHE